MPSENANPLRIPSISPNHASVSFFFWVKLGNNQLLLGPTSRQPPIRQLAGRQFLVQWPFQEKLRIFKVAHHGSQNAHESRVWSQLLIDNPFAILTPFRRGDVLLPTNADVNRISMSTSNGYITAEPTKHTSKWTHRVVKDTLRDTAKAIHPIHQGWGQIRLRRKANDRSSILGELTIWHRSFFN